MGDRRQGDRREPEKGVVRVKFSDAVICINCNNFSSSIYYNCIIKFTK